MTAPLPADRTILETPRLRCDYFQDGDIRVFHFAGAIAASDWHAIRAIYRHVTGVTGGCAIDLRAVSAFDATLYSVLVWVRLTRELHGARFAIVAGETTERRLNSAGIGKWLPGFRTLDEARVQLTASPGTD